MKYPYKERIAIVNCKVSIDSLHFSFYRYKETIIFHPMKEDERQIKTRKKWLQVYHELGSVSKAALRCGVARSTLHRWIQRYDEEGESGLPDK